MDQVCFGLIGVRGSKDGRSNAPIVALTTAQFGDLLQALKAL
ncbi:hypothetical protein [Actinomadura barringtoniae]|nr:hypothetical protein [Actinomadura barringtoniae]